MPLGFRSPGDTPILVPCEGIFPRRQGTDTSCSKAVGIGIVSADLSARDRPCDRLAADLRVVGNDKKASRAYRVAEAEASQAIWNLGNDILERLADLAAGQLSLKTFAFNGDVVDVWLTVPLRQGLLVFEKDGRLDHLGRWLGRGRFRRFFHDRGYGGDSWGRGFGQALDLLALFRQFGGVNLSDREPPGDGAAGPLSHIGFDEGVLNLDLLVRQLEYAVLVDLIADFAEEIRDLIRRRSGIAVSRLRQAIIRRQHEKADDGRQRRPPDPIHMRCSRHWMP